jgi:gluconokinase
MIWVLMGIAGSGKSRVGAALAARLGVELIEGDDLHSQGNRRKMQAGTALTDAGPLALAARDLAGDRPDPGAAWERGDHLLSAQAVLS